VLLLSLVVEIRELRQVRERSGGHRHSRGYRIPLNHLTLMNGVK
jgi:hypothetical protein